MTRRLRAIDLVDIGALARLHAECFPDDRWDAKALAELLAMSGASGYLVEEPGVLLPLGLILDLTMAGDAEILTLAVAPEARRQGLAQWMLTDSFERVRAAGARSIRLEVAADNATARRLYERCGFRPVGRRRGYYRRGSATIDALLLRRALAE
jgi:ribosomal-protein-alanine N-acetyltransferase